MAAEVKNEWNYTSALSVSLHGLDKEDFLTFLLAGVATILLVAVRVNAHNPAVLCRVQNG